MFSVIVPLYNKEAHVSSTISSVLQQTYKNFEIVIVNDGSTDRSLEIVGSFEDSRIRVVHQKNSGVSSARNRGIVEANFEYIVFLDSDDYWADFYLDELRQLIERNPNCGIYSTEFAIVDRNGNVRKEVNVSQKYKRNGYLLISYFETLSNIDGFVWTSATCVPKKIFYKFNIWFPEGETYGEDQYVWSRIAMHCDIAHRSKVCSFYVIDADNNTVSNLKYRTEPSRIILRLIEFSYLISNDHDRFYFERYIENKIVASILRNVIYGRRIHAIGQIFKYNISWKKKMGCFAKIFYPHFLAIQIRRLVTSVMRTH